jgi:hypothetical protein
MRVTLGPNDINHIELLRAFDIVGHDLRPGDAIDAHPSDERHRVYRVREVTEQAITFEVLAFDGTGPWDVTYQRTFVWTTRTAERPTWLAPEGTDDEGRELSRITQVFTKHGWRTTVITEEFSGVDPNELIDQDEADHLGIDGRFDARGPDITYGLLTSNELLSLALLRRAERGLS